jgi:diaminohydroxyphosphoribosylaminopyrimidine deaminase / 5-amino-6-(5-phosphoribosylamino)uracil reductase
MQRCLQLARLGFGMVAPNPMVGCVIVHQGVIIGEGYHTAYGKPHAEVEAIHNVKNKELLKDATLYVNLEPCAHFGKTPPCANLLVQHQLKSVVIGSLDVNPEVAGKGVALLKQAGIEVVVGVLEKECKLLNQRFFTWHLQKRPYIILKWAQSADGFVDKKRVNNTRQVNWITGEASRQLVHLWRSQEQCVMVGDTTVINDNPSLTVRLVNGKNSLRAVISPMLDIPSDSAVLNHEANTVVFYVENETTRIKQKQLLDANNALLLKAVRPDFVLQDVLQHLHQMNIQSVFVEGGTFTISQFLDNHLWDEARVLKGKVIFNEGLPSPQIQLHAARQFSSGKDEVNIFYAT